MRLALGMRDSVGVLAEKWRRNGHDLGFGIGIATGYATLGMIGFDKRREYTAIGRVTNLASRLCDEAKAGQKSWSTRGFSMRSKIRLRRERWNRCSSKAFDARSRRMKSSNRPASPRFEKHEVFGKRNSIPPAAGPSLALPFWPPARPAFRVCRSAQRRSGARAAQIAPPMSSIIAKKAGTNRSERSVETIGHR